MLSNPYTQYQESNLETASQGKLLLMLYDGAIRFLLTSQFALEQQRWNDAHTANLRAQDIVTELMLCLNMETGEIANNLYRLYDYMNWRLVQSNIRRDVAGVREIISLLRELREAWVEVVKTQPTMLGAGAA
ncbi:MAG: flagellar export chaperone FliS [Candidatus Sericytochromatia bacterium]|nr:flagellar export chaperone FliS [Candidatus Sericytochromatia bacterium]